MADPTAPNRRSVLHPLPLLAALSGSVAALVAYAAYPAWQPDVFYAAGTLVSYNGRDYRALVNQVDHSGTGWNPTVPTLWEDLGPSSGTPPPPPPPGPGPSPTPTPTPPPPGPAPTPVPGLARHALVGYWHNFTNPAGNTFPLSQVPDAWDVVAVAFGDNAGGGNVSFTVDGHAGSEAQFIADVAALRARGKKVVLSLGGQNGSVSLNTAAEAANFTNSLHAILQKFGFDGIDLDIETGVSQGAPIQAHLVSAVKALRARVGSSFYLSMAPEWPYVQGGYVAYGSIWGAYLPIIDGLRNELSIIHVQYYNNGGLYSPYAAGPLPEGSVDMLVGGSKMLIEGFPLSYGAAGSFAGLRPDQVAFGVPSGPRSANSGFVTAATVNRALDCLTRRTGCGSVLPAQAYPSFRGVMTWSINWDRFDGFNLSAPVSAHLDTLP
jgi:chitinase